MRINKYILGIIATAVFSSCADRLDVTPPNNITDEQIQKLLASGDQASINLVMGSMANNMPLLFNFAGIPGVGVADVYYSIQGLEAMRSIEGNDIVLGDVATGLSGLAEYQFGDFISPNIDKNNVYWYYAWNLVTQANKMLNFLTDEVVGSSTSLKNFKARGLVIRAYGYYFLMENYQEAYLQGGNSKLGMPLYDRFSPTQANKARTTADETFAFIKGDLDTAIRLLAEANTGYTTNEVSDIDLGVANFIKARVSLWTGDWAGTIAAADKILSTKSTLMTQDQYGAKNTGTATAPVYKPESNGFLNNAQNPEVILGFALGQALTYHQANFNPFGTGNGGLLRSYKRIDNRLYEKIADNDYRKDAFQKEAIGDYTYPGNNTVAYIPSYTNLKFAATHGLEREDKTQVGAVTTYYMRTSEVLLMKAEAQAQAGNAEAAKATLNTLLAARTRTGETPLTCDTYAAMQGLSALEMVQLQTRIELWGEGGREFYNNKRWNIAVDRTNSENHVTKVTYPVSKMTLMIPQDEMLYNPLMQQN